MSSQRALNLGQIKQGIEETSGYPFELEVVRRVEKHGDRSYWVQPNYSFEDQDSGEARELDFHAIKAVPISVRSEIYAYAVILGSCKNNRNPYVFFTRRLPFHGFMQCDAPISGYPLEIFRETDTEAIDLYLRLEDVLHVAKTDIVSSQMCELAMKSGDWEVKNTPILKDTTIPLIKAMSREIEQHNETTTPDEAEITLDYRIYYPLLVLRGPMLEYYLPPRGDAQVRNTRHITVMRHYESQRVRCQYAIDVVHESYLQRYLDLVDEEINSFTNRVRRRKKEIIDSAKRLAKLKQNEGQKADDKASDKAA